MLTIAYLANLFPAPVEPYVGDEIHELRRRGINVISGSVRRPKSKMGDFLGHFSHPKHICLYPIRITIAVQAFSLLFTQRQRIGGLIARVLQEGNEPLKLRLKALLHTWMGAYYAVLLRESEVAHIHVHHGYFGSWIGMLAARLLGISFSVTLHGSDLLLHGAYLDTKLQHCRFCVTISEYNRGYILKHFPEINPEKITVSRLGVKTTLNSDLALALRGGVRRRFSLLAVGRLHATKDHAFLIRACAGLRDRGLDFECALAGEGPEREHLEKLIRDYSLRDRVTLLGHVQHQQMESLYQRADLVVLTSRSEGIPLVLMEAMALGTVVLAPAITGIPELIVPGKTGFLYKAGVLEDFEERVFFLEALLRKTDSPQSNRLAWISHAARVQVNNNFNHQKHLMHFGDFFLRQLACRDWSFSL